MFVVVAIVAIDIGQASFCVSWHIMLLPLLIVQMVMLSTGVGITISALTTKYRDLAMLVSFGLELWKYASPVAYGLALIPTKFFGIYMWNPVTTIITAMRYAFFGTGYFVWSDYILSWIVTTVIFLVGMILFNRIEKTFMDTI